MSQHLLLDWSTTGVVVSLLESGAGKAGVSGTRPAPGRLIYWQRLPNDERLDEQLSRIVAKHRFSKASCGVMVGRDVAELRPLALPPVPDNELPDIVRFQAIRSFASAGDRAVVDYLITDRTATGVQVLVAATSGAKLQPIRQAVEAAGLKVQSIVLRPTLTAAWVRSQIAPPDGWQVIVDVGEAATDLIYVRGGEVQVVRTVRTTPGALASQDGAQSLAGEIRRGLIAGRSGSEPTQVLVIGGGGERLQTALADEAVVQAVPIRLGGDAAGDAAGDVDGDVDGGPPHAAAILGLVNGASPTICFENPRRRVEPVSPARRYGPVGVAAALAVLAIGGYIWNQLRSLDRQIQAMQSANGDLAQRITKDAPKLQRTATVDRFLDADVAWAGQLATLAQSLPPAEELIVRQISGSSDDRAGGGQMILAGAATSPEVIAKIEQSIRRRGYEVDGQGANEIESQDAYRWRIRETVRFDPAAIRRERLEAIDAVANGTPSSIANSGGENSEKTTGNRSEKESGS